MFERVWYVGDFPLDCIRDKGWYRVHQGEALITPRSVGLMLIGVDKEPKLLISVGVGSFRIRLE